MGSQLRLSDLDPPHQLLPSPAILSPRIWVRELRVLKEFLPGDEHVARRIVLRCGLNVLWSRPAPSGQDSLFESALQGHTAGKTTFCRLLRYALGEDSFGDETLRNAIRGRWPKGRLLAEVVLDDVSWIVCRPFSVGPHSFVLRNKGIEHVFDSEERDPWSLYQTALRDVLIGNLPLKSLPESDAAFEWTHLLAWISRDQECRMAHLLEWRHPTSGSEFPKMTREALQLLVRSVLNLISDDETQELAKNQRLLDDKEHSRRRAPLLQSKAEENRQYLEMLLGQSLPDFSDGLFSTEIVSLIDQRAQRDHLDFPSEQKVKELEQTHEAALRAETDAKNDLLNAQEMLRLEDNWLKAAKGELTEEQRRVLLDSIPPTREYCSVPLDEAKAAGCPLFTPRLPNITEIRAEQTLEQEIRQRENNIQGHYRKVEEKSAAFRQYQTATKVAKEKLDSVRQLREDGLRKESEQKREHALLRQLADRAQKSWREARSFEESLPLIETQIRECQEKAKVIRQQHRPALNELTRLFDYIVCALLGKDVVGSVGLSGREIDLSIELNGQRTSTAIETIKIIAFDLAAVIASVEGFSLHPRLLIHDCPREADMDPTIYRRLFLFTRELEKTFDSREPSFQYIITTTEPPPTTLQIAPWLLDPVLDASRPETRLLGADL